MMERLPEPELMDDGAQALAYARADFAAPHDHFVALLGERLEDLAARGAALDLGCGPGDVTYRFAAAFPGWTVEGLDGAAAMLDLARRDPRAAGCADRVSFTGLRLPAPGAVPREAALVFSNSLLHHLAAPLVLWRAVVRHAAPGARVFVMDLMRPSAAADVDRLVEAYAADEPELLRRDFRASLRAAYTVDEVRAQLAAAGLGHLAVEAVSDRHWIAWGGVDPPSPARAAGRP